MSDVTEKKPPRKFPPPCWTQDEALVLIEAYRERWYALRRGYLRTADWDAVAAAVGQRFPAASPPKTSAQCRHKMEKLRQRYRVEKQRSLASYPGRFFSSWFFFESMDSMEHGSVGSNQDNQDNRQNLVTIGFYPKDVEKIEGDLNLGVRNSVPLVAKSRVLNGYNRYAEYGSDEDADEGGPYRGGEFHAKTPINGSLIPHEYRTNKSPAGKMYRNSTPNFNGGCQLNTQIEDSGFRAKKSARWEDGSYNRADVNGDFWVKVAGDRNQAVPPFGTGNRNINPNSSVPPATERRKGGSGVKRGKGPVEAMVESIRYLGDGFIEMEKMKMATVKEIENKRIEMETKRHEMLMKSQQQIIDAFVKGLADVKNKVKTSGSPDS